MSLPELTLTTEKNQRNVQANRLTVRESEKGLTLVANIVSGNGLPYDLTGLTLQFCENKQDGKAIIDPAVSVLDSKNGRISYVLHSQAYACSGSAWFEILSGTTLVDSTQNFSIKVESTINVNVDSSDYIGNLEALRQQLQTIVDNADSSLESQLASFQTQFNNKLSSLQSLYTAAESNRDSDWQADKTAINSDWQALKTSLNSQISSLQTLLNNVQAQVNTLNNTSLPAMNANVSTVSAKVTQLQQDLSKVDWSSYVKSINGRKPDANGDFSLPVLHTAWSWSIDGKDRFMTSYPNENLLLDSAKETSEVGNGEQNQFLGSADYIFSFGNITNIPANVGGHFTFSADILVTGTSPSGDFQFQFNESPWNKLKSSTFYISDFTIGEKKRITFSSLVDSSWFDSTNLATGIMVRMNNVPTTITIAVSKEKFELENTSTDWSPAPSEDPVNAYPVYRGEYTDYTEADSTDPTKYTWKKVINAADINNALTTAKSYTDTTASTTLSNAKSYTDTKMSNVYTKPQVDEAIANAKPSGNYQKSWSGTLSQYQALGTYDTTTVYYILSGYEVVTS